MVEEVVIADVIKVSKDDQTKLKDRISLRHRVIHDHQPRDLETTYPIARTEREREKMAP